MNRSETSNREDPVKVQYHGKSFQYNSHFLILIVFTILPLIGELNMNSMSVIFSGFTLIYILDFLRSKKWAFISLWITLFCLWCSMYLPTFIFTPTIEYLIYTIHSFGYFIMCGMFLSLQSQWFKTRRPKWTLAFEKLIFSVFPILCLPNLMNSIVSVSGVRNVPFYLFVITSIICYFFTKELKSSFLSVDKNDHNVLRIQRPIDSLIISLMSSFLPVVIYLFIYKRVYSFTAFHILNTLFLLFVPLTINLLLMHTWWIEDIFPRLKNQVAKSNQESIGQKIISVSTTFKLLRTIWILITLTIVLIWFEYRVLFARYPHLVTISYPYNYVFVTCSGFLVIAVVMIFLFNFNSTFWKFAIALLISGSIALLSFALGFSLFYIPIPVIAAASFVLFLFERNWKYYLFFVVATTFTCFDWLTTEFSFMDFFEFDVRAFAIQWTINMKHVTWFLTALLVLSMVIVWAINNVTNHHFLALLFMVYGILLAICEQFLYEQPESGFYSQTLVILTTILGVWISQYLVNVLSINYTSIITALYLSKLAMFLDIRQAVLAMFFTIITFVRIVVGYNNGEHFRKRTGWFLVAASGVFLFLTRHILTKKIINIFFQSSEISRAREYGVVFIAWAITISPLTYSFISNVPAIKQVNIALLIVGGVLAFLQPLMEKIILESIQTYAVEHQFKYISWLFVAILCTFLSLSFKVVRLPENNMLCMLLFLWIGLGTGWVIADTVLFYCDFIIRSLVVITFILGILFLHTSHFVTNYVWSLIIYIGMLITFPLTLWANQLFVTKKTIFEELINLNIQEVRHRSTVESIFAIHTLLNIFIAITIKYKLQGSPLIVKNESQSNVKVKSIPYSDGLASICNLATLISVSLSIALSKYYDTSTRISYLLLSPLLLLLSHDGLLLKRFKDSYRYLVMFVIQQGLLYYFVLKDGYPNQDLPFLKKLVVMLKTIYPAVFALPAIIFATIFFCHLKRPSLRIILCTIPLSFLCFISELEAIQLLGILAILASVLQITTAIQWIENKSLLGEFLI